MKYKLSRDERYGALFVYIKLSRIYRILFKALLIGNADAQLIRQYIDEVVNDKST
jgi:hypothetical protein